MVNKDTTLNEQDTTPTLEDVSPKVKEPTPGQKEPTPKEAPKTLTAAEAQHLVQLATMTAGREKKVVELERDGFKAQSENLTSQIEDSTETIKKLEARIDDLASNDPEKFEAVKELRDARIERVTLKADRKTLEADKQVHKDSVTRANETLREISIWEVAAEHEGGDPVKLKDLCDIAKATSDEDIAEVADTLWPKKAKAPETPPLVPVSGKTSGGGEKTGEQKLKERYPTMK